MCLKFWNKFFGLHEGLMTIYQGKGVMVTLSNQRKHGSNSQSSPKKLLFPNEIAPVPSANYVQSLWVKKISPEMRSGCKLA